MQDITTLKAETKRYQESVVMVHHYGGHKFSFKRQIEYLNSIGLDVHTFDLPFSNVAQITKLPTYKQGFGIRHKWASSISKVLDQIEGPKFIYSFSSPSAAALEAMAARNFKDILGWICDGGPFVDLHVGITNLVREGHVGGQFFMSDHWLQKKIREGYTAFLGHILVLLYGSYRYEEEMAKYLRQMPKGFPVMSFRTAADKLVYPEMIDGFFKLGPKEIVPVLIERAPHLAGFKDSPERYKTFLLDFFKRFGTPI